MRAHPLTRLFAAAAGLAMLAGAACAQSAIVIGATPIAEMLPVLLTRLDPTLVHASPELAVRYRLKVPKYRIRGRTGSITIGGMNSA